MGALINFFQVRDGDFSVDAGGVESRVAEELLDDPDICAVFVHVGGAAVAEEMAASGLFDADLFDGFGNPITQVAGADSLAVTGQEEGLLTSLQDEFGAAFSR